MGEILLSIVLALIVAVLTYSLLARWNQPLDATVLMTTIGAAGQLLGFGAIVLAIFYPFQRSLISDLRSEISSWQDIMRQYPGTEEQRKTWVERLPARAQTMSQFDRAVEYTINELRSQISRLIHNYAIGLAGFTSALIIWALDLVLELVHLSIFPSVSTPGLPLYLGFLLVAIEFALVTLGLGLFIGALIRSVFSIVID
jgi:hypothetical protein